MKASLTRFLIVVCKKHSTMSNQGFSRRRKRVCQFHRRDPGRRRRCDGDWTRHARTNDHRCGEFSEWL